MGLGSPQGENQGEGEEEALPRLFTRRGLLSASFGFTQPLSPSLQEAPVLEEGDGVCDGAIELCTDCGGEGWENTFSFQEEDRKSCPCSSREMGNTQSAGQPFPSAGHL